MVEEWAPIEHLWEVNRKGQVRNKRTGYILKNRLRRDGYIDVKLNYRRFLVHRLVAMAFLSNPNSKAQVNHKDGVRSNTNIENLEWVDQFENMEHALRAGLFPDRKGEKNGRATITKETAEFIKRLLSQGLKPILISEQLDVSIGVVRNIKRGAAWK